MLLGTSLGLFSLGTTILIVVFSPQLGDLYGRTLGPEDLDSICCVPETHLEVQDMENTLGVGRNSKVLVELACVTVTPKDRLEAVELHGGFQSKESGTALTSHNGRSYFPLEWLFVLLAMKPPKLSRAILKIPSVLGRHKAFSTCSSHLGVVTLFYGSATVVYLKRRSRDSVDIDKYLALFYTIVTPMFNPLIYSLRNKESIFSAPKLLNANSYFKLCLTKVTLKGNSQSMANSKWGPEGDTIDEEMTIFRAEKPLARPHGLPTISPHGISLKKIKDLQVIFCCCPEDLDNIRCVPETHLEGRDMEKAFDVTWLDVMRIQLLGWVPGLKLGTTAWVRHGFLLRELPGQNPKLGPQRAKYKAEIGKSSRRSSEVLVEILKELDKAEHELDHETVEKEAFRKGGGHAVPVSDEKPRAIQSPGTLGRDDNRKIVERYVSPTYCGEGFLVIFLCVLFGVIVCCVFWFWIRRKK
ncbi:hypothetical protein Q9966_008442 [Columba livia]|nr:hypothetical protein Q9966_008442 [Columba livia]